MPTPAALARRSPALMDDAGLAERLGRAAAAARRRAPLTWDVHAVKRLVMLP